MKKNQWMGRLWDAWCLCSVIGIWPRFIEPNLLATTRLSLKIDGLPIGKKPIKIAHFSDLHWNASISKSLKKKLIYQINDFSPDLILFTGDFLCRSHLEDPEELQAFLCGLKAKVGCFAVLGNHDYANFVTVSDQGHYDVEPPSTDSDVVKGFKRLFSEHLLTGDVTESAMSTPYHTPLIDLLKKTPFSLLDNRLEVIEINGIKINLCGLGEYTLNKHLVQETFKDYNYQFPGIILAHNPDLVPHLLNAPGDIILCGHTHGGQVNLPFMWKKFTKMENLGYKSGLRRIKDKWIYVNRGVSSVFKFRWFAMPELTLITLNSA